MATTHTHEDHVIERDGGSGAAAWVLVAILVVVLALILFGSNFFSARDNNQPTDINIRGNIETPTNTGGSGTGTGGTTAPAPTTPTQ